MAVIDGDTIEVQLDGKRETVRYYGIDTPERQEPCYEEAKKRNEELADRHVLLMADARDRDSGGRLLRYIFTLDGYSIDAALVAEGFAHAWTSTAPTGIGSWRWKRRPSARAEAACGGTAERGNRKGQRAATRGIAAGSATKPRRSVTLIPPGGRYAQNDGVQPPR